jgi:hypothetical protein
MNQSTHPRNEVGHGWAIPATCRRDHRKKEPGTKQQIFPLLAIESISHFNADVERQIVAAR